MTLKEEKEFLKLEREIMNQHYADREREQLYYYEHIRLEDLLVGGQRTPRQPDKFTGEIPELQQDVICLEPPPIRDWSDLSSPYETEPCEICQRRHRRFLYAGAVAGIIGLILLAGWGVLSGSGELVAW